MLKFMKIDGEQILINLKWFQIMNKLIHFLADCDTVELKKKLLFK